VTYDYHEPDTLAEALDLLAKYGSRRRSGAFAPREARSRDELAGRADAHWNPPSRMKGVLQGRQRLAIRETLDGRDLTAIDEDSGQQASGEQIAVDEDAARATDADGAPLLRAA